MSTCRRRLKQKSFRVVGRRRVGVIRSLHDIAAQVQHLWSLEGLGIHAISVYKGHSIKDTLGAYAHFQKMLRTGICIFATRKDTLLHDCYHNSTFVLKVCYLSDLK